MNDVFGLAREVCGGVRGTRDKVGQREHADTHAGPLQNLSPVEWC